MPQPAASAGSASHAQILGATIFGAPQAGPAEDEESEGESPKRKVSAVGCLFPSSLSLYYLII